MERINFTTRVLGPEATNQLMRNEVTQTLRAKGSSITKAILTGEVRVGDQLQINLIHNSDSAPIYERKLGMVELCFFDRLAWSELDISDARRGGFESLEDLAACLKRAGYRFQSLDTYTFYRIQFQWLRELEYAGQGGREVAVGVT